VGPGDQSRLTGKEKFFKSVGILSKQDCHADRGRKRLRKYEGKKEMCSGKGRREGRRPVKLRGSGIESLRQ